MEKQENTMEKRYGLPTALSMVIGIVIGSGIFFKAVKVMNLTGGNMIESMIVIGVVGLICIVCSMLFARMGRKYAKCNGLVDYAEVTLGPKYAYYMGWYLSTFYFPIIASTLAYIAATYFCMMVGLPMHGQASTALGALFLVVLVCVNMLNPKIAGKLQVSTTVIKLIPLIAMTVVGLIIGIGNGTTIQTIEMSKALGGDVNAVFGGVCAFAFSYEGWISATAINQELKNAKRDLPLALIIGGLFCTALYMLYVLSMSATLTPQEIIAAGDNLPMIAFGNVFGQVAGKVVMAFIVISCLGTSNGMMMCTMRGFYSLAVRNQGPKPEVLATIDKDTGMPLKSCILGLLFAGFWYFQFSTLCLQGPLVFNTINTPLWFFAWEADEICIIAIYLMYIPIFLHCIFREKEFSFVYRYVLPILAIVASLFMSYCAYISYGAYQMISFLVTLLIVMIIGRILK